jgi:hypothetical protein
MLFYFLFIFSYPYLYHKLTVHSSNIDKQVYFLI